MKGDYHKWGVWRHGSKFSKSMYYRQYPFELRRGKYYLVSSHKTEARAKFISRNYGLDYKVERV